MGFSGSGVAFKLAWKLAQLGSGGDKVTEQFRHYLLDAVALASLGTIADVVPLHDENRIFVRAGLNRLRQAPSVGLKALIEAAGLSSAAELRASDVGYRLAPRLNAAGRLGCARLVVELLTTTSPQRAADSARFLEQQNAERQTIERRMVAQARELVERQYRDQPALVLASRRLARWRHRHRRRPAGRAVRPPGADDRGAARRGGRLADRARLGPFGAPALPCTRR